MSPVRKLLCRGASRKIVVIDAVLGGIATIAGRVSRGTPGLRSLGRADLMFGELDVALFEVFLSLAAQSIF